MEKKHKLIYWILTILMFVPGVIGGVVEVFTDGPESIVKIMLFLGYPLYLMEILGFAKLLGGAAILYGKFPMIAKGSLLKTSFKLYFKKSFEII